MTASAAFSAPPPSEIPSFFCKPENHERDPSGSYCLECGLCFEQSPIAVAPKSVEPRSFVIGASVRTSAEVALSFGRDANGHPIPRANARRLHQLSLVSRQVPGYYRRRINLRSGALRVLSRAKDSLGFGYDVRDRTIELVEAGSHDHLFPSMPVEQRVAACLFVVLRSPAWVKALGPYRSPSSG